MTDLDEKIAQSIFDYYRKNGFPFKVLKDYEIWQEFRELTEYTGEGFLSNINNSFGLVDSKILSSEGTSGHLGQGICETFMPHQNSVKISTSPRTPMDTFLSDKHLKIAIGLANKNSNGKVNDMNLRTYLRLTHFTQYATNFRSSLAKQIYDYYKCPFIYDYSSGFGGRLLGFIASNFQKKDSKYIAVEPCSETYAGLIKMVDFFDMHDYVELHKSGSEDFRPSHYKDKFGLAFSSPPYFNKEIYSDEETQSCIKFPVYTDWRDKFWFKTMENIHYLLKKGGVFIVNINDIKDGKEIIPLVKETADFADTLFSSREKTFYLPHNSYGPRANSIGQKVFYEVFMVWKK